MPQKPRVRTLMDGQHVKGRKYFCYSFQSLSKKIRSKSYVLVVSEIWRLFLNILTPEENDSLSVKASF